MITGGQVLESAYEKVERAVREAVEKGYPKAAVRAMLAYGYKLFPEEMSDNGSISHLTTLLKFFDQKWAEVYGK